MSWFKDSELFVEFYDGEICIWRLRRKFGSPIEQCEFTRESNVTNYLSLVENSFQWKKSDFDALADLLYKNDILVNCQGLVLTLTFPRDSTANNQPDMSRAIRFWSHDVVNLACYGLPVSSIPFREVQYIEGGYAPVQPSPKENELAAKLCAITDDWDALEAEKQALQRRVCEMGAKIATLNDELQREKNEKNALIIDLDGEKVEHEVLKKRVSELEAANATLNDKLQSNKDYNYAISICLDGEAAPKQEITEVLNSEATSSTLKVDLDIEKDETRSISSDQDRMEAEKQALEKRVADLEATNAILNDELQREKEAGKQPTNDVPSLEATSSTSKDDLLIEKVDEKSIINDGDQVVETTEKEALEKRISELEAMNATLKDELQKEKDDKSALVNGKEEIVAEKQGLEKTVVDLQATNTSLINELHKEKDDRESLMNDLDRLQAEKEVLDNKVSDLETIHATLNSEIQKSILNDLDRHEAEKQALEKIISDLEATKITLNNVEMQVEKTDYGTPVSDSNVGEADKQTLKKRISDLEAIISVLEDKAKKLTEDINIWLDEISDLHEQLNQENKAKQALEKKVVEFTSKLEKCTCGAAAEESSSTDKELWMNDSTVPTNWVPYEELVQAFSRSTPLDITKACECGAADLSKDSTTNIQVHYFYRGLLRGRPYPIMVVNVEELIPNKEKARFDPSVWGLFNNAGTYYAARKPFESEM
ncbi:hypothetical protein MKX01_035410 [Papaver californicum]|nr:hypothetical protein MKX01_035410 [Papaver californicum]